MMSFSSMWWCDVGKGIWKFVLKTKRGLSLSVSFVKETGGHLVSYGVKKLNFSSLKYLDLRVRVI